ncbi:hypothetical protein [Mycolicibacterium brisbanense]|uniref:hypothetical protein n=1 Tax=Mycolicibacterium brisbanense TaxID=146020 RepID=UPI00093118CA|nr:hypothetical protein [Mycolicibacterium brisbanense]
MCRAVTCRVCGKTTWAGCGMHVDAVRRGVPAGQWCAGHASGDATESVRRGWFGRRKTAQDKT